jgi:hypothetical protein
MGGGAGMITVEKVVKWRTSDGAEHSSEEMAHAYILNADVCELFSHIGSDPDPQDIVNTITSNRKKIREFLDSCDAMEKASLK